jgi:hypothetical protein
MSPISTPRPFAAVDRRGLLADATKTIETNAKAHFPSRKSKIFGRRGAFRRGGGEQLRHRAKKILRAKGKRI